MYIYIYTRIISYHIILCYITLCCSLCHRVKNRTCSRAHFRKLGWGGDNSNRVYRYAIWSSLALHATLLDFHLHFHDLHLHFMLRYLIFTCTFMIFTCTSCYATWFSLALSWSSLALHATLLDFHLWGKNPNGKSSCLLTDGAPCYPKVAK